jgi:DNA-binding response OmpR family regulator
MKSSLHALVVDDESKVRYFLQETLRLAGYTVEAVGHTQEALALLRDRRFDVVLLDLRLEEGGNQGLRILKAIRWRWPETVVIILTAYASLDSALEAIDEGVDGYLQKPVEPGQVRRAIRKALDRRQQQTKATQEPTATAQAGDFEVHRAEHWITLNGTPLDLTPTEFDLLAYFVEHAGEVLSPRQLVSVARDYTCEDDREARDLIKWFIYQLRQKIEEEPSEPQWLLNVRGVGYMLDI